MLQRRSSFVGIAVRSQLCRSSLQLCDLVKEWDYIVISPDQISVQLNRKKDVVSFGLHLWSIKGKRKALNIVTSFTKIALPVPA
jgi:hypothetical protein